MSPRQTTMFGETAEPAAAPLSGEKIRIEGSHGPAIEVYAVASPAGLGVMLARGTYQLPLTAGSAAALAAALLAIVEGIRRPRPPEADLERGREERPVRAERGSDP